MTKITIPKAELDRLIKEESMKFKKAITLKKELAKIQGELDALNECQMDEVKAGAPDETGQRKPIFHNPEKNPHTMMEDEEEITDTDVDIDNAVAAELDADVEADSDTISKAEVMKAIDDLKMALNLHSVAVDDIEDTEAVEDIEDADVEADEDGEEANSEDDTEGDEIFEFEGGDKKMEEEVKEEATAPVAETEVKEEAATPVAEEVKEENTLMESEKRRMAVLAGLMKG